MERTLLNFAAAHTGTPFVEDGRDGSGWDCWGLVVCAFRELGIDLAPYELVRTKEVAAAAREIEAQVQAWSLVALGRERAGDVVHLRPAHLGVVLKKGVMLHALEGIGTSLARYNGPAWARRILGIYRHGKLARTT